MREHEVQATWVRASLDCTLQTLRRLVDLSMRGHAASLAPLMRDYVDHVEIWAAALANCHGTQGRQPGPAPEDDADGTAIEAAALAGRLAAGMAERLRTTTRALPPETRRLAMACLTDLDNHLRWASGRLRGQE